MLFLANFFTSTDADCEHLGRVDVTTLSDQTLMEMVVADIKCTKHIRDAEGDFRKVSAWPEVISSPDGKIKQFWWLSMQTGGTIHLEWMPSSIEHCGVSTNGLQGTLQTIKLPRRLIMLDLSQNEFTGTFAVENLPANIRSALISFNKFDGTLALTALPPVIKKFDAYHNQFTGYISLHTLPSSLQKLSLGSNQFSGTVDLREFPPHLHHLYLNDNGIEQDELTIGTIPADFVSLDLRGNRIVRLVNVHGKPIQSNKVWQSHDGVESVSRKKD